MRPGAPHAQERKAIMPEENNIYTPDDSPWPPFLIRDMLERVDQIHRAITRAIGRIEYLKMSAYRANSTLTPVRYGRGVERSRIEYAVLESEAERWGIGELKKELEEHLQIIRPLVQRLPAGIMRAVATQRILDGVPCGIIGRRMHFSRSHVYRLLNQATERIVEMHHMDQKKKSSLQKQMQAAH